MVSRVGHVSDLEHQIHELWDQRDHLDTAGSASETRDTIHAAIDLLDRGEARVAEVVADQVVVHEWLKQAILLLFRISKMETIELGPFEYADKIPLKHDYEHAGVRVVPGGPSAPVLRSERGFTCRAASGSAASSSPLRPRRSWSETTP